MAAASAPFLRPTSLWQELGLRANQTVVHLGCGAGYYLPPAARLVGPRGQVIGIDIREEMVSEAASRARRAGVGNGVRVIRANLENSRGSTLADGIADFTLVANILYQAAPAKIMAEAARVTKPGGTIVVIEWDTAASPLGPPLASRIPKQQTLELAVSLKLKLEREFRPSPYHYGLLLAA
ncbi:MAG: class I SAM-dependent methyltransferase [Candidatus Andersenbacteria bacterium]|nr:class I SAM-dependent methyltransferase [Candidatus Andersenbacteria bacterium]